MSGPLRKLRRGLCALAVASPALLLIDFAGAPSARALGVAPGSLVGVFSVKSGSCSLAGAPSGSYLELLEHGVPVPNVSSPCTGAGSFYTPLRSGAVGLVSGAYQPDPQPTFDAGGNSVANQVVDPVKFLGVGFGLATTCADQQHAANPTGSCPKSGPGFPLPQLFGEAVGTGGCQPSLTNLTGALDECLYGNLEALGASYNGSARGTCASAPANGNGCYDVGAATGPSLSATSCGSAPVGGCSLSGTFDPVNSTYTLDVASTIVGTPFNGAQARFHLVGTFVPGLPARGSGGSSGSGGGGSGGGGSGGTGAGAGSGSSPAASPSGNGNAMVGNFTLFAGACGTGSVPQGSWIQLGLGGSPIRNSDSSCDGGSYTLVSQGSEGLVTGRFQPNPTPTFDSSGNSLAALILRPAKFLGTDFGAATDPQDEQTAPSGPAAFPVPQAVLAGTRIHANLSSINFTYNGTPDGTCASGGGDGCYALGSTDVLGSYDPTTRAYTLQWTGTIHGGAFNNATATFHFAGVFHGSISQSSSRLSQSGTTPSGASLLSASAAASGPSPTAPPAGGAPPQADAMIGTFTVTTGYCTSGSPGGSWIQLSKGGAPIANPLSTCDQGDYTTVSQGTEGLVTGRFQPDPVPTFDGSGNSLAGAIIKPTPFLGADFGAATDPQDMQHAPAGPGVYATPYAVLGHSGTSFTADLAALNFTYNGPPNGTCLSSQGVGCYSVGSPDVAGTYDPRSHSYSMEWSGLVAGGAFNGATATFHLSGIFKGTISTVAASSVPIVTGRESGAASPVGGVPAPSVFRAPTFQLTRTGHLRGSGPLATGEEVVSALLALVAIGLGLSSSGRPIRGVRAE